MNWLLLFCIKSGWFDRDRTKAMEKWNGFSLTQSIWFDRDSTKPLGSGMEPKKEVLFTYALRNGGERIKGPLTFCDFFILLITSK